MRNNRLVNKRENIWS